MSFKVVRGRVRLVVASLAFIAGLASSVSASRSVTVAWDPNPETNITHYHVLYGTTSQTYTHRVTVSTETAARITDLQDGITYYFAVTAENSHGLESDPSVELSYTVPVTSLEPVITWAAPAAIVYGRSLDGNQLNATASVPGVFVYQPPAGTVLNAGAGHNLSLTFTPNDLTNYQTASRTVSIDVAPAPLTIRADDLTRMQGEPNPPLTASYTGLVNGDTAASLDSPPTLATPATPDSPPGTYSITVSGGVDLNYTITHVNGVLTVQGAFQVRINFQPQSAPVPSGYLADAGEAFGSRNGHQYGWDRGSTSYVYDRNSKRSPDQRYDTFAWMDRSNGGRVWELAVPVGRYEVFVVAGDPSRYDSTFRLELEGILAVDGIARRDTRWLAGLVTVDVQDGRLTLRSGSGARNNKVCFLDLTQLAAGAATAQLTSEAVPSVRLVTPAADGPQRLRLSGIPGTRYRLQASPDLSEWSDMLLLHLNRTEFEMLDPDSPEEPLRFYRLLEDVGTRGAQ